MGQEKWDGTNSRVKTQRLSILSKCSVGHEISDLITK